jgi:hypothetical protein
MEEPMTLRHRGAQPNNTNALKHGFYSRRFRQIDRDDLDALPQDDRLDSEINAMRVLIRRALEETEDKRLNLSTWMAVVRSVSNGFRVITDMLIALATISREDEDMAQAVSRSLVRLHQLPLLGPTDDPTQPTRPEDNR